MRERSVVLVVGAKGSGKSTLSRYFVRDAQNRKAPVRVLDPGDPRFPRDPEASLSTLLAQQWRGLLLCDDADQFIPRELDDDSPWRQLALRNRHHGVDLLLVTRRPANLPAVLLSALDELYVFQLSAMDTYTTDTLRRIFGPVPWPLTPHRFVRLKTTNPAARWEHGRTHADGSVTIEG